MRITEVYFGSENAIIPSGKKLGDRVRPQVGLSCALDSCQALCSCVPETQEIFGIETKLRELASDQSPPSLVYLHSTGKILSVGHFSCPRNHLRS